MTVVFKDGTEAKHGLALFGVSESGYKTFKGSVSTFESFTMYSKDALYVGVHNELDYGTTRTKVVYPIMEILKIINF